MNWIYQAGLKLPSPWWQRMGRCWRKRYGSGEGGAPWPSKRQRKRAGQHLPSQPCKLAHPERERRSQREKERQKSTPQHVRFLFWGRRTYQSV